MLVRKLILLILSIGLISGQSTAQSAAPEQATQTPARGLVPIADHHVHLFSPLDVDLSTPPLLPRIKLPAEVAQVVSARERLWHDQRGLEKIYTENALYDRGGTAPWVVGRKAAAGYVRWTISDTPYHIKPVAFSRIGNSANVAGYFVEADGSDRHFGSFIFSLAKAVDGKWRIAAESYTYSGAPKFETVSSADQLIAKLDAMGIKYAAILSDAYYFDSVRPVPVPQEYAKVRAENDWTAAQVARFPSRLVGFCSFNPLRNYALTELERCFASHAFTGLKLHFNAAQLDFGNPEQIAKVRKVMAAANQHHMPIIIHVRPGNVYGRFEAETFLHELVAAAPDVPIQIAHLWGGESYSAEALAVYAQAVSSHDPVTRNLYFDLSGIPAYARAEDLPEIAARVRQIGIDRMLFGSDAPLPAAWLDLRKVLPLTDGEFARIAGNVAPYFNRLRSGAPKQ